MGRINDMKQATENNVNLQIKIVRDCIGENNAGEQFPLSAGTVGKYRGHVPFGNIKIEFADGRELIVHPRATDCN
jgi:hypothetical protein